MRYTEWVEAVLRAVALDGGPLSPSIYLHLLPDGKLAAASKFDRFFAATGS